MKTTPLTRRALALALALCVFCALTACGTQSNVEDLIQEKTGSAPAADNTQADATEAADAETGSAPADAPNDTLRWFNATYAIYTKVNDGDPNLLGGFNHTYKLAMMQMLEDSWDITDKAGLEEMIASLREGRHNQAYLEEMEYYGFTEYSPEEMEAVLADADLDEFTYLYYTHLYNAYYLYGEQGILGWDLSRAAQLAATGYVAGYFTEEEALDSLLVTCQQIQGEFASWENFADSYLYGYVYWSEEVPEDETSDAAARVQLYGQLANQSDGPFSVDWSTNLEKTW